MKKPYNKEDLGGNKMIDKILNTYFEYRQKLLDNYEHPENFNVVIRILPEKFWEIIKEVRENNSYYERDIEANCYFIEFAGRKTPLIIDKDLQKNTEFIIQSQRDYEREEQEKQFKRFLKMFGD